MGINSFRRAAPLPGLLALLMLGACAGSPAPAPDSDDSARAEPILLPELPYDTGEDSVGMQPPLLSPLRDALSRGDWIAATLATPNADPASLDSDTRLWLQYFRSRIAYLRGDLAVADTMLSSLDGAPLPEGLRRELLLHRLRLARLAGDGGSSADLAHALYRAGGHPELPLQRCEALLWSVVQDTGDTPDRDRPWYSWWDLARAASMSSGKDAASALTAWLDTHPVHPARERAQVLLDAARIDATIRTPALLVPLSGPLELAGEAVTRGAIAAYYAQPGGPRELAVIDSRRHERMESAYNTALERGADVLMGPLGKLQVGEMLGAGFVDVPIIALNRPETPASTSRGSLQLSLATEDEAALIARRAFAHGGRQALLVRPEGEWGERMEAALLPDWSRLGGQLRGRAIYGKPDTHSGALKAALNLDASGARERLVQRMFSAQVTTVGRRRQDIDVIFLLAKNAEEARALKPLINYHYAGDLPVYAISTADDGGPPTANRDLDGLRLPVMPWRLGDVPPGLEASSAGDSFSALHAMGADAWELARRAHRLTSGAGLRHAGYTAHLRPGAGGVLRRELPMAEFDRGRPQLP